MATTKNPFVSFIEGWANDPEGQAKGQVYAGQANKLGNENAILADRIAARARMMNDPNTPAHIREMLLANDVVDPTKATGATREFYATNTLFPGGKPAENLTPQARSLGLAGWGLQSPNDNLIYGLNGGKGVAPSGKGPDIQMIDGLPYLLTADKEGKPTMVPVPGAQTVASTPPAVPGDKRLTVTKSTTPEGVQTKIEPTIVPGSQTTSMADLMTIAEQRRKTGIGQLGKAALDYPTGPSGYLLDEALGRLGSNGAPMANVKPLNPLQQRSIIMLANQLQDAGYSPREAFNAALSAHPDVQSAITAGKLKDADFNKQFGWDWTVDNDANKNPLPDLGGTYRMPESFVYKGEGVQDYSNAGNQVPVPFMTMMASQPDLAASVAAGQAARPAFANKVPDRPEAAVPGQYYYSGTKESPRFVVARTQEGKIVLVPITGLNQ